MKKLNLELLPRIDNTTTEDELKENYLLNKIFEIILTQSGNDIIDDICRIYINGKLGVPNHLENIGRYKDAQEKLIKLRQNKDSFTPLLDNIPASFDSLIELVNFISENQDKLDIIDEKNKKKIDTSISHKKIREVGEPDVNILLDNKKVIIYEPTSEDGAKYYGRGTQWCTSAMHNNMYNYYRQLGPLYIIQSKTEPIDKFQIHFQVEQAMTLPFLQ